MLSCVCKYLPEILANILPLPTSLSQWPVSHLTVVSTLISDAHRAWLMTVSVLINLLRPLNVGFVQQQQQWLLHNSVCDEATLWQIVFWRLVYTVSTRGMLFKQAEPMPAGFSA